MRVQTKKERRRDGFIGKEKKMIRPAWSQVGDGASVISLCSMLMKLVEQKR